MNSENSPPGKGLWGGCQMSFVHFYWISRLYGQTRISFNFHSNWKIFRKQKITSNIIHQTSYIENHIP